ncbi:MAG: response regulator [Syntrophaceae bacterium]
MDPVKQSSYPGGVRALLLEDSEADAELIRFALRDAVPGLTVKQVDTRDDFVRELKEFSPQIILSDYLVPGFDGRSALRIVRDSNPDLPFVFISGALGEELAVELLRAGATDYILKDRMSRLPSAVIRSLEDAREKSALAQRTAEVLEKTAQLAQEVEVRRQAERELLESQRDLRRLALEISRAENRELRRIAVEIHERIGQNLVLVLMSLEDLKKKLQDPEELGRATALIDKTVREVRSLALEASPPVLYEFGIFAALEWLCETFRAKSRTAILLQAGKQDPLPSQDLQVFLFKAVWEMVRNALQHAAAKNIVVRCGIEPEGIYAEVQDDGSGFGPAVLGNRQSGLGLFSIRERLTYLGGSLSVESSSGGSLLRITLPPGL